jgi:hypothetical protein
MDCPNCGVYNPEEREVCWRCNTELPKQAPPKRRSSQQSARVWLYVALALFAVVTIMRMCGTGPDWLGTEPGAPEGRVAPAIMAPAAHTLTLLAMPGAPLQL